MSDTRKVRLSEACKRLGFEEEFVFQCIRAEWIHPASPEPPELDEEDLARLELIRDLREGFGVNEESLPIILHLLDQLYDLRNRFRAFEAEIERKRA
jgi:chaperone modulatory protein CbpM